MSAHVVFFSSGRDLRSRPFRLCLPVSTLLATWQGYSRLWQARKLKGARSKPLSDCGPVQLTAWYSVAYRTGAAMLSVHNVRPQLIGESSQLKPQIVFAAFTE